MACAGRRTKAVCDKDAVWHVVKVPGTVHSIGAWLAEEQPLAEIPPARQLDLVGGHAQAVGLTVAPDRLDVVRTMVVEWTKRLEAVGVAPRDLSPENVEARAWFDKAAALWERLPGVRSMNAYVGQFELSPTTRTITSGRDSST